MDEVPEKKFWIFIYLFLVLVFIPLSHITINKYKMNDKDKIIDNDKMTGNDKMTDNDGMKMKGGGQKHEINNMVAIMCKEPRVQNT